MMFDYVHDKFNNIKDDLTQSFILAIEGWKELRKIKEIKEDGKEDDLVRGSCLNMHSIKMVCLDPKTGHIDFK